MLKTQTKKAALVENTKKLGAAVDKLKKSLAARTAAKAKVKTPAKGIKLPGSRLEASDSASWRLLSRAKKAAGKSKSKAPVAKKTIAKKTIAKSTKASVVDIAVHKRNVEMKAQAIKLKIAGKLSQKEIAEKVGAPQSSVWRWTHTLKSKAA